MVKDKRVITILPMVSDRRRVACYCRVSSLHDDQCGSIEAQREHFVDIINENPNYTLAGVYVDHGISGTKQEIRPGLLQLLKDCKDRKIDLVLTKSLSRFARNSLDTINMVRTFRDLGVEIYFERENLSSASMEGEMSLSIMATLAEDEARQVSANAKWAIAKRFQMGTYRFSRAPYGYVAVDYDFQIDPEKSAIVHRIFMAALKGKGSVVIARELTEDGVPSPAGLPHWSPHTINRILRDTVYIGDLTMQKTYTDENYRQHVNNGQVDKYVDEDHHDPIINREVFVLVGEELSRKRNQHKIDTAARRYVDLPLYCAHCGAPMWKTAQYYRMTGGGKKEEADSRQYYYVCSARRKDPKSCSCESVLTESLDNAMATMVNKLTYVAGRVKPLRKEAEDAIREIVERRLNRITMGRGGQVTFHFYNGLVLEESVASVTDTAAAT